MMPLLLLICAVWIAAGVGRTLVGKWRVLENLHLERFVFCTAVGLGIAAYGVLLLGLCGLLSFWPITGLWLGLGLLGHRGLIDNTRDLIRKVRKAEAGTRQDPKLFVRAVSMTGLGLALIFVAIAVLSCFKPPDEYSWDALAYHLADPKLFLMDHRITSLPTEHHSNFPLLMEMLYTVGLLYDGYTLANLFHFLMALLTGLGMFGFCQRRFGTVGGWCAVIIFWSTPVVLWEAGVSYIELGLGLYTTLACFAAVEALSPVGEEQDRHQWLLLSGITMGFGLGTKYLALIPFGIVAVMLLIRSRSLRKAVIYGTVALVIGSPWFVKNILITHNPVYPYMFKLFPNSRYWTADRAKGYESEQERFGAPHSLQKPLSAATNLLEVPWDLLTFPLQDSITGSATYSNAGEFNMMTMLGSLTFAFNAILLLRRRVPRYINDLCILGMLQVVAWFFVAQVSRYLVSVLPLLAVTGAYAVSELVKDCAGQQSEKLTDKKLPEANRPDKKLPVAAMAFAGIALCLIGGQALMTLWIVMLIPPQTRLRSGAPATVLSVPQIVNILSDPDGKEEFLKHKIGTYAVVDWINHNAPKEDGVLLYDDTLGFYLDRKYLWANGEHSAYIPYDQFADGRELTDWMVAHHYRFAMFNMKWNPYVRLYPELEQGGRIVNEELAFERLYRSIPFPPDPVKPKPRWRGLVGDAIRRGLWQEVNVAQNGVYLMHIGPPEEGVPLARVWSSTNMVAKGAAVP